MTSDELYYILALTQIPNVGPKLSRNLIAYCSSPEAVLKEKKSHLQKIPGIGEKTASAITSYRVEEKVEKEIEFIQKHKIKTLYFLDENYPERLKDIESSPIILFFKGNCDLNNPRTLAIVGTRKSTPYGKSVCERICDGLTPYSPLIVSGLAYGIDHCAHKSALKNNIPTLGVLGHGLDIIYPYKHRSLAENMLSNGGLLTEYFSGTKPDKENFPARNRIVAGLVDAVIVVETGERGGALITAEIAYSYNRDVFTVPGRVDDPYSAGCNRLIKLNKAVLVETAEDIAFQLGWDIKKPEKPKLTINFSELTEIERDVISLLKAGEKLQIDALSAQLKYNSSELSLVLLDMEFRGFIRALPGNVYQMNF